MDPLIIGHSRHVRWKEGIIFDSSQGTKEGKGLGHNLGPLVGPHSGLGL